MRGYYFLMVFLFSGLPQVGAFPEGSDPRATASSRSNGITTFPEGSDPRATASSRSNGITTFPEGSDPRATASSRSNGITTFPEGSDPRATAGGSKAFLFSGITDHAVDQSSCLFDAQAKTPDSWVAEIIERTDDEVSQRLAELDQSLVEHRDDPVVRRRIAAYVEYWRSGTEVLLGRAARFFPIFEQELTAAAMPDAIKYLTVPESALRPWAISEAGAAGLWQLMPGTARELGLRVDSLLDERQDLRLSTQAGLAYLAKQYERFEDWTLAMAAYNCGPGGVLRAMRRSGSRDYWRMRRFLPRETRNYIPNYIAAVYLSAYFHAHQLEPYSPSLDMTMIESVSISGFVSLHRIAQVCQLRPAEVLNLNPAYLKGFVPEDGDLHYVYLPARVIPALHAYLRALSAEREEEDWAVNWLSPRLHEGETQADRFYTKYRYFVFPTDSSYAQVSQMLDVPATLLHHWNYSGTADSIAKRDYIDYYRIESHLVFSPYNESDHRPSPSIAVLPFEQFRRRKRTLNISIPVSSPIRRRRKS